MPGFDAPLRSARLRGSVAALVIALASAPLGAHAAPTGSAAAPTGSAASGAPAASPHHTVDLAALRDHDLFDGARAPLLRVTTRAPWAPPVPLDFDPAAAPDAVLLKCADAPAARTEVTVPVGRTARTLYLLTAGQGPLSVRDIVADGSVRYADGRTQPLKWMVGEQAWPAWAGATGRNADPLAVGWNPSGDLLTASLLTVDASWPDVPIASITLTARPGPLAFALLAVTVSDLPPVTSVPVADRGASEPPGGVAGGGRPPPEPPAYDFRIPGLLPGALPIDPAQAVRGPADRRVTVRDGHLAWVDGGDRARFWGINLVREGALPAAEVAEGYARSLARAGFNLARLHHMDFEGSGSLLNPRRGEEGQPVALPEALDRMDRFHAALKAAGVYTWLETWTLRSFRPEEGLPAPEGLPVGHKYVALFEPEYAAAKKAWVRALYDRTNPYTGLRYADDPAVLAVELANEDSLVVAWNGGNLERLPGPHRARLDARWNAWLRARYRTDEALAQAWKGNVRGGLLLGESLSLDSVAREPASRGRTELYPTARAADLVRFYSELEAAHLADMARYFHEELGFTAPTVCNTSFAVPQADALLAACDIVDQHLYWDPIAETNVFFDHAFVERPLHGRPLEKLAACQAGKPCTMSELNTSGTNRYAQEAPLVWASLLARQDLDAVIWFAWSHSAFDPAPDGPKGALDLAGRFSTLAQMPTASALFRSGEVAPPARRFVRWWSPDGLLRDLAEPQGLWLDAQVSWRSAIDTLLRTSFDALPPGLSDASGAVPDATTGGVAGGRAAPPPPETAPVRWWPDAGRWVVDTPRVQAVVGRTRTPVPDGGQGAPEPGALRVSLEQHAAVSLAALDGAPLGEGTRALLVVAGRTERDGTLRSTGGPGTLVAGNGPARLERLDGWVDVRWEGRPQAWTLDATGTREVRRLAVRRLGGGWWRIDAATLDAPWLLLRTR